MFTLPCNWRVGVCVSPSSGGCISDVFLPVQWNETQILVFSWKNCHLTSGYVAFSKWRGGVGRPYPLPCYSGSALSTLVNPKGGKLLTVSPEMLRVSINSLCKCCTSNRAVCSNPTDIIRAAAASLCFKQVGFKVPTSILMLLLVLLQTLQYEQHGYASTPFIA
jgi:hypothetical protein